MQSLKSYSICKHQVYQAYLHIKSNKGSYGVDNQSMAGFEKELKKNLYRIWNRLSSGSYYPPAVREVSIPKGKGRVRKLGIPTISDRIAQMVAKQYLEPILEPHFHADSYGYRPRKSAIEALKQCKKRCWEHDWVIDIDIKGFFDHLDHALLLKAVDKHCPYPWVGSTLKDGSRQKPKQHKVNE